ncbi:inosine/xanthosine triphosphatase [Alicyclobacillus sacchari]|uniref:Probable inosine/xanthosine triphosphatase n=1 Tax=Alicyclobacillus sacchari TaxID=392010 RepID=A0A4R8LV82_9BACL|nr:inosine/xanthosine triphosphatase [Alicyclobacillus sacchari]TDY50677.1 inosine/xanthosine triphosphatase [Alicyclobacillus sacchari]GMA55651.1 NTPase [Alicyclobacillus sacchari]
MEMWNNRKIAIGSTNPAKIQAVELAFAALSIAVEIVPVDVPSGVSPQPQTDTETLQGARNRAQAALQQGQADVGIGLEGGIQRTEWGMFLCNWACAITTSGQEGLGGGLRLPLPYDIAIELDKGRELGDVIDAWAGRHGVRKQEGTIGILTQGAVRRADMFRDALLCALAPLMHR